MYTIRQKTAILSFFDQIEETLKNIYQTLINRKVSLDNDKRIIMDVNGVYCYLVSLENYVAFFSGKADADNIVQRTSMVSIWSGQKNIGSGEINDVCVTVGGDTTNFEQYINDKYEEIVVGEFYELILKQTILLQKELNLFCSYFGIVPPILKPLSDFISDEILSEEIPKKLSEKKLREYGVTTIVAAAIIKGNYVWLGETHSECGKNIVNNRALKMTDFYDEERLDKIPKDVYVTSDGEIVTSTEAWQIAIRAGQIDENSQCFTFYSEDCYSSCRREFDIPYAKQVIMKKLKSERLRNQKRLNASIFGDGTFKERREMQNGYVLNLLDGMDANISSSDARVRIRKRIINTLEGGNNE